MATPRLLLFYSRLFRASLPTAATPSAEAGTTSILRPPRRAAFASSPRRCMPPETINQRYGTANEPPAHIGGGRAIPSSLPKEQEPKKLPDPEQEQREDSSSNTRKQEAPQRHSMSEPLTQDTSPSASPAPPDTTSPASPPTEPKDPTSVRTEMTATPSNVLHMQPPMSTPSETAPPHLQTPPHVHHFDTYTLVRDLMASSAFTDAQAITLMKALRLLLANNIDLARAGIMSKSDAEMDAYQFRAASSELRTEIRQRRAATSERIRADRTQLQHEVDVLSQRMTQESLNLKDELKGMFDDRKMNVRMERRALDNRIQELGYKITVAMNSGMRTEIEALRFSVTRNAAITLAAFILGSLLVLWMAARRKARDEKTEKERKEKERVERRLRERGRQPSNTKEELAKRVEQGEDPALVSLG